MWESAGFLVGMAVGCAIGISMVLSGRADRTAHIRRDPDADFLRRMSGMLADNYGVSDFAAQRHKIRDRLLAIAARIEGRRP